MRASDVGAVGRSAVFVAGATADGEGDGEGDGEDDGDGTAECRSAEGGREVEGEEEEAELTDVGESIAWENVTLGAAGSSCDAANGADPAGEPARADGAAGLGASPPAGGPGCGREENVGLAETGRVRFGRMGLRPACRAAAVLADDGRGLRARTRDSSRTPSVSS